MNQLYCTETGSAYPSSAINTYTDDNKALLRRMFGEAQLAPPAPEVTPAATVKNIFMFPQKIFDHTKTMSGEDRLHSAAVHGGAAGHNSGLPGAKGKYLKIKIQCSVPKKHLNVTIVIRTLQ